MSRIRIAALLAVIALIPAAAEAQSTITACYVPKSGSVYRVGVPGTPEACKSGHVEFSWETGGAAGIVGYQIRGSAFETVDPNSVFSLTSQCQTGELAVSGGFGISPAGADAYATNNGPLVGGTGWTATVRNSGATAATLIVWAVCVQAAN